MTHPALIERITRSLAYMLRHQPEQFDLDLDEFGWADLREVVRALNERLGEPVGEEDVNDAVHSGDRQRYEIEKGLIRALYGHSIDVQPGEPSRPPEWLYVGVSGHDAERAQRFGLRPGRRRFLHLALTPEDALDTAVRTAEDAVLVKVHALEAWEEGINFYDRKSLFLSDPIPTHYLEIESGAESSATQGGLADPSTPAEEWSAEPEMEEGASEAGGPYEPTASGEGADRPSSRGPGDAGGRRRRRRGRGRGRGGREGGEPGHRSSPEVGAPQEHAYSHEGGPGDAYDRGGPPPMEERPRHDRAREERPREDRGRPSFSGASSGGHGGGHGHGHSHTHGGGPRGGHGRGERSRGGERGFREDRGGDRGPRPFREDRGPRHEGRAPREDRPPRDDRGPRREGGWRDAPPRHDDRPRHAPAPHRGGGDFGSGLADQRPPAPPREPTRVPVEPPKPLPKPPAPRPAEEDSFGAGL